MRSGDDAGIELVLAEAGRAKLGLAAPGFSADAVLVEKVDHELVMVSGTLNA